MKIFPTTFLKRGFSTLELMIAFALMALVLSGVILAHFASAYWAEASQTSNEALYNAKTQLEELRGLAQKDFLLASSSPTKKVSDTSCSAGGLCYYLTTQVSDLSTCSKYVNAQVDWQVQGYPTTTTSLFTNLTNTTEAVNLGGDCPLTSPSGTWGSGAISASSTFPTSITGNANTIDALGGYVYAGTDAAPYLQIASPTGTVSFNNGFTMLDAINGIDVARDLSTGRVYAYLAMASTTKPFAIVDVTDVKNPVLVTQIALQNATDMAWRVAVYSRTAYVTTRETAGKPELHSIDVSTPSNPTEYASALELNTSAYGLAVRDQKINNVTRRFAFIADTLDAGEVKIAEVTDPNSPSVVATLNLPNTDAFGVTCTLGDEPGGMAVSLAGNVLYVGREHSTSATCKNLPNIYSIDISNPLSPNVISSAVADTSAGAIVGLKASGDFLYALVGTVASPSQASSPATNLLDADGNAPYLAKNSVKSLQVWKPANGILPASPTATFTVPNIKIEALQSS